MKPPLIAAMAFLAAWLLQFLLPEIRFVSGPFRLIGPALSVAGLALGIWAIRFFHAQRTTHDPFGKPTTLATRGPYRFSRNPMYLGVAVALFGLAIYGGNLPLLLAPLVFVITINQTQIPYEEELLKDIFGDGYVAYKMSVRRWA